MTHLWTTRLQPIAQKYMLSLRKIFYSWDIVYIISITLVLISGLLAFFFVPIQFQEQEVHITEFNRILPFDVNKPNWSMALPPQLIETSAVAVNSRGTLAWVVNDEDGYIFTIDLTRKMVTQTREFAPSGDYEGIEHVNDAIVVSRSDGQLFLVNDSSTQEIQSPFKDINDIEGLAFDIHNNRILVAFKGKAGPGSYKNAKSIGVVQLPSTTWSSEPAFVIDLKALRSFLRTQDTDIRPRRARDFAPSAIAIDPKTTNIYILSSRAKMLLVVSPTGELLAASNLSRRIHSKPEGLSFDENGAMYISNEGRSRAAMLYRFERIETN